MKSRLLWLPFLAIPTLGTSPAEPASKSATVPVYVTILPYLSLKYDACVKIVVPSGLKPKELKLVKPAVNVPVEVASNTPVRLSIPQKFPMKSATDPCRPYWGRTTISFGEMTGTAGPNQTWTLTVPAGTHTPPRTLVKIRVLLDFSAGQLDSPGLYTGTLVVSAQPGDP